MITILCDHHVTIVIEDPTTNAGTINYKKNQAKKKRIIYDSVKYSLIWVITPLNMRNECFETLTYLYEKKDHTQKRSLKNNLYNMNMERDDTISSFSQKFHK